MRQASPAWLCLRLALSACVVCCVAAAAHGQTGYFNPASRYSQSRNYANRAVFRNPSVSPYLNLLQNNAGLTSLTPNYQSFVRPQLEARRAAQQSQRQLGQLNQQVGGIQQSLGMGRPTGGSLLRPTGRQAGSAGLDSYYGNRGHYYQSARPGGS